MYLFPDSQNLYPRRIICHNRANEDQINLNDPFYRITDMQNKDTVIKSSVKIFYYLIVSGRCFTGHTPSDCPTERPDVS